MPSEKPRWQPITEPWIVFRFVKDADPNADGFAENFASDQERGKSPLPDEHPDLLSGMSAFASEEKARRRWTTIRSNALRRQSERNKRRQRPLRMSVGDYIAEVELVPNEGFEIIDLSEPDGHLTIRGDKHQLAARVVRVYPAESQPT
jgi:hypothetical protein